MMRSLTLFMLCALIGVSQLQAGGSTVQASNFLSPRAISAKTERLNSTSFVKPFMLHHDAASQIFNGTERELTIKSMLLPPYGEADLQLVRTPSVFDANTQFLVNTKNGKMPFRVRPISSYKGTVNGDPSTAVTLHYSEGNLVGFVQHADGKRTVIGIDYSARAVNGATPHVVADEAASVEPLNLSTFNCGADLLPVDQKGAVTSMLIPSSIEKGESPQQKPLKELKLAVALREDVDSFVKLRYGWTEEQLAQHFTKIVAAMSQAYEEDLNTRLYISYMLIYTEDAPSGYFNTGSDPGALLEEFSLDWSSGYGQVDRAAAHLYTLKKPVGGTYVGGIAYGGQAGSRLCVKDHRGAYGVSTIDMRANEEIPGDPTRANAFVWDVFVAAHEIGHNVGAPHTHNCFWSPPVDTCQLKSDNTDACYDTPVPRRVRLGTIMSYCHLVNGSTTPLTFGSRVAERMRTWVDASSCIGAPPDPVVSITTPRGSEEWDGGQQVTIKWVTSRVDNVNLHYSTDDGANWNFIAGPIPAVDSQYVWTLPAIAASELWIRLSDASNVAVQNISIASHKITVPLAIVAPAGGERLAQGRTFNVRFNKEASVGPVAILFAPDGTSYETIASDITTTSYDWTVPNIETSTARIRVVAQSNSQIVSTSNPFAIGVPRFELLLPAEGADFCNNQDNQFNWSADFVDRIRIEYSADGGVTWRLAVQQVSVPAEQWQIFSRNSSLGQVPVGSKIKLRVLDNADREIVYDTRDVLNVVACDAPVSVDEDVVTTGGLKILGVTPNPASSNVSVNIQHNATARLEIIAIDQAGASVVLRSDVDVMGEGSTVISVPVDRFASGSYRLVVRSGATMADAPLTIIR